MSHRLSDPRRGTDILLTFCLGDLLPWMISGLEDQGRGAGCRTQEGQGHPQHPPTPKRQAALVTRVGAWDKGSPWELGQAGGD